MTYMKGQNTKNNLKQYRVRAMMSKAELARKSGVSVLTITRAENGKECRVDTKRKIMQALGLKITDRERIFPD